ncbi:MAG: YaeQ family protein [Nevskia sp.]|nr:YaeQ family protein [Nevskia sp.]
MALKATIHKALLQVADMDRNYYGDHALTVARHPSETDERMMLRLVVFALHAHEHLEFGRGLSDSDEPDLWRKDLTGRVQEWIELGQPDERTLLKACGRADRVWVYGLGAAFAQWWKAAAPKLERAQNLEVRRIAVTGATPLAALAQRSMQLQCTIQERQIWLADGARSVEMEWQSLRG